MAPGWAADDGLRTGTDGDWSGKGEACYAKARRPCIGPATFDLSKRAEQCPPLVVNSSESPTTSRSIRSTPVHQRWIAARRLAKRTHVSLCVARRRSQAASRISTTGRLGSPSRYSTLTFSDERRQAIGTLGAAQGAESGYRARGSNRPDSFAGTMLSQTSAGVAPPRL